MKKLAVLTGMTMALTASSMFGGQIVQTFTFPAGNTEVTDAASLETINYFQSAAGYVAGDILTSVTLQIQITQQITSLTLKNTSAQDQTFTFFSQVLDNVNGTAPDAANLATAGNLGGSLIVFNSGSLTLASGASVSPMGIPASKVGNTGVYTSGTPGAYDTTGTFTLSYNTLTQTTFSGGGGNIAANQSTNSGAVYTVIYNYNPPSSTPEPATMTLFGSALLGIGFFARKRLKK